MSDTLKIGLLTSWNTRCGIAEYSRYIATRMRAEEGVELTVFGSRNSGVHKVREDEPWVVPCFDIPIWADGRFDLDVETILAADLDVLHVQYQMVFYNPRRFAELMRRFPGVKVVTYHDNDFFPGFDHEAFDVRYTHREGVGRGECIVVPHGLEDRPPVVKTFGRGRSRSDIIAPICDRNGWRFEEFFGGTQRTWLETEDLYRWLRDSDAIVLWYDEAPTAGSSGAVRIAISTRRWVVCNDTSWFHDLPETGANFAKVHTPEGLEAALRAKLDNDFIVRDSWTSVVERHLADYRGALGRSRRAVDGAREVAVLAFADELVEDPALLRAFGATFGGADGATLVIHVAEADLDRIADALGRAVEAAGLDGDDAADLLAVPGPETFEHRRYLARRVDAVLSRRSASGPLARVPRFDAGGAADLRALAERRWAAPAPAG
jgi:hypothetical protein